MPVPHFSPNPHDNEWFLQQQVDSLSTEQKSKLIMWLAQQYYRQGRSFEELQSTFTRLSRQHDRALHRIACMEETIARMEPKEEPEED